MNYPIKCHQASLAELRNILKEGACLDFSRQKLCLFAFLRVRKKIFITLMSSQVKSQITHLLQRAGRTLAHEFCKLFIHLFFCMCKINKILEEESQ